MKLLFKISSVAVFAGAVVIGFQNCSPVNFAGSQSASSSLNVGLADVDVTPDVVADVDIPTESPAGISCVGTPENTECPGSIWSDGTVFLGTISPGVASGSGTDRYMTTPGGCGEIPSAQRVTVKPSPYTYADYPRSEFSVTCSGTDSMVKSWNGGSSDFFDIPALKNYFYLGSANRDMNPDEFYGSANTTNIVALRSVSEGSYHAAARYCDMLVYGGHRDWYLPNREELNLFYVSKTVIPGLYVSAVVNQGKQYWSSTESTAIYVWKQNFSDGRQYTDGKHSANLVRCVRRL